MRRHSSTIRTAVFVAGFVVLALVMPGVGQAAGTRHVSWPQFHGRPDHRGINPFETSVSPWNVSQLSLKWIGYGLGSEGLVFRSSPALAAGMAFFGATNGDLYAFPANGCGSDACFPVWTGSLGEGIYTSPAVANGVVYIASASNLGSLPPLTPRGAVRRRAPRCGPRRSATSTPLRWWRTGWSTRGRSTAGCTRGTRRGAARPCASPCGSARAPRSSPGLPWRTAWSTWEPMTAGCTRSTRRGAARPRASLCGRAERAAGWTVRPLPSGTAWCTSARTGTESSTRSTPTGAGRRNASLYGGGTPPATSNRRRRSPTGGCTSGPATTSSRSSTRTAAARPSVSPCGAACTAGPNGVVYVGENNGYVYMFDGRGCGHSFCYAIWQFVTQGSIVNSSPVMANGTLYVTGSNFGIVPELYVWKLVG